MCNEHYILMGPLVKLFSPDGVVIISHLLDMYLSKCGFIEMSSQ